MASDNFDRGDGGLGANWTSQTTTPAADLRIVSNEATYDATADYAAAYWNAQAFNDNQYSEGILGEVETGTGGQYGARFGVRMHATNDTGYYLCLSADSAREVELIERVAGTDVVLDTDTTGSAPVITNTARIDISAAGVITGKVQGSERVGITDTTIGSGKGGIAGAVSNAWAISSWAGDSNVVPEFDGRWQLEDGSGNWTLEDGSGYWVGETFVGGAATSLPFARRDRRIVTLI